MFAAIALGLVTASFATAAEPAMATKEGRLKLVLLDLDANGVDASLVKTITDTLSSSFARFSQLDVVTAADVRAMMNVDAAKQQAGECTGGDACMSEIASALGADLLVHGSVGKLGDLVVVNISLFDARKSTAVGRQKVQSADLAQLSTLLDDAAGKLAGAASAGGAKAASAAPSASSSGGGGVLLWTGVGVGALGVLAGAGGFLVAGSEFGTLQDPTTSRTQKDSALGLYPVTLTTGIVGAAAVAAGASLIGVGVIGGGP
jgi:TolB-like protein